MMTEEIAIKKTHTHMYMHTHTHTNKDLINYATTPPNYSQICILTDYFNDYNFSKVKLYAP